MFPPDRIWRALRAGAAVSLVAAAVAGCRSPAAHRHDADRAARRILDETRATLDIGEDVHADPAADTLRARLIQRQRLPTGALPTRGLAADAPPSHWPDDGYLAARAAAAAQGADVVAPEDSVQLSLTAALQIAAGHSRDFLSRKESLFKTALALDLARNAYRSQLSGKGSGGFGGERADGETTSKATGSASSELKKSFQNGGNLAARVGLDLVEILSGNGSSSAGIAAEGSLKFPLLRGAGRHIAAEPLVQAERNMIYAVYEFERHRQEFVVRIASDYFDVLNRQEQVRTAMDNDERVKEASARARRLADAGRIPEIQVDQAGQSELRARDAWVAAVESAGRALDGFKLTLGLPADACLTLDPSELKALTDAHEHADDEGAWSLWELAEEEAVPLALEQRMDLKVARARIEDAERAVVVAADNLRAELTLLGESKLQTTRTFEDGDNGASTRSRKGIYSALLSIDLPIERTAERNAYRESLYAAEKALRDAEGLEDTVKSQVRSALRNLVRARESAVIQRQAVLLARRRERSTNMFMQAGRAEIRDLLDAQDALLAAQDALTSALVRFRVAELETQRDLGLLRVDERGVWRESIDAERNPTENASHADG